MKKVIWVAFVILLSTVTNAQELYVSTEPASNMATRGVGFRLLSKLYKMDYNSSFSNYRIEPEVMWGASRHLMVHLAGYASDMFQKNLKVEGASVYAKYRFYSRDDVHKHFRMAAYSKLSLVDNPEELTVQNKKLLPDGNGGYTEQLYTSVLKNNEFDIDGNNSGITAGIVATKLVNKIAASASLGYGYRLNNLNNKTLTGEPLQAITYTTSFGYLLLPKEYVSYHQTNVNLYVELLGTSFPGKKESYTDIAPAIQFIINSIARVDLAYKTQLAGNTARLSNNYFMIRLEYNILNAF